MENREIQKVIFGFVREIAEREKKKAINTNDYGTALVAAIVEGIFREAESRLIDWIACTPSRSRIKSFFGPSCGIHQFI